MSQAVPQPTAVLALEDTTELLLIRHGRSDDVVPGSPESEDPPLHAAGVEQAAALAARLAEKRIDAVYASNLRRAIETAAPIAAVHGLEVEQVPDLREVFLGEWERGEFRRLAAARDPEFVRIMETGRWDGIPGGESDDALRRRVRTAIDGLAARHAGESIAVVCHGGVINAYVADVLGVERTHVFPCENTSVTLVRTGPRAPVLLVVNDCHHLYDPVLAGPPSA